MPQQHKKILASLAALAALGLGGSAIAGAASNGPNTNPTAIEQSEAAEAPGTEAAETPGNEAGETGDAREADEQVAAADAKKAGDAALAEVGSGKVTDVSAETQDDDERGDKPEKGDTPDPAYEQQVAYEVEVTRADGSEVEVQLDKSFNVLGTQQGDQHEDDDGEQTESAETAQR